MKPTNLISSVSGLRGNITVPGDKSISHRAIMLGALSSGDTHITGFLMGEDCLATIDCFRKMGVQIDVSDQTVLVHGVGLHGLQAPFELLYTGNSGTTTRLLTGILAGQPFMTTVDGDDSIQNRPMGRIMKPLHQMGADIAGRQDNYCPLTIFPSPLHGIRYEMPVASAQLKSSILLAGLYADSPTTVVEPAPSRDHTERMLRALGVTIHTSGTTITLTPPQELLAADVVVPGDISSAAYFLVAGLIIPNSEILIQNVGVNPTRTGILDVLNQMGADITRLNERGDIEPVCDLLVRSSPLHGTVIDGDLIPRLIDEIPVLAVAAAFAEGETVFRDAQELKVKESNRIATMTAELRKAGVSITETEDGMRICGGTPLHGADFTSYADHRVAMSMAVCALGCHGACTIDDPSCVAISYPNFFDTLSSLEANP